MQNDRAGRDLADRVARLFGDAGMPEPLLGDADVQRMREREGDAAFVERCFRFYSAVLEGLEARQTQLLFNPPSRSTGLGGLAAWSEGFKGIAEYQAEVAKRTAPEVESYLAVRADGWGVPDSYVPRDLSLEDGFLLAHLAQFPPVASRAYRSLTAREVLDTLGECIASHPELSLG